MKISKSVKFAMAVATLVISATFSAAQELRPWMHSEIGQAWRLGYKGQRTSITVIDDFASRYGYYGALRGYTELRRHGEWTALEASMIAPSAKVYARAILATSAP